ncbi:hypothetical protein SAMN05216337_105135 [Bradyrhizobium brasilense]|uniref:Uncharacterized protein n=1 Tax=Bradyrhizobium brasilense TaxID=1419277 RepID=A0A1G7K4R3_9BRAD|nr:hypothetical protein SAMN05216337_105135 [Bradyrhizobium brasilense]
MLKGFAIAVIALSSASQVDRYFTHGRYTDAIMAMLSGPYLCWPPEQ